MELKNDETSREDAVDKTGLEWTSLVSEEDIDLPMICGHRAVVYQNFYYVIQGFDGEYTPDCYRYSLGRI